ncbi:unnamed protein product [Darwinula stevensoni]|uniref:Mitochondrial 3-ketoacyl-coa thiolase n=1 Tax=Darwinula stevensoni TaxID=69355 RepID=A0A7R9FQF3_9CRUS|nr:unnamed protein product [Darwinula stevensoni]CAG0899392.1 unnamed protein product [Darwinula stevensoni]
MARVFIVGAKRTPFGTYGGAFLNKTCVDLQEVAGRAALGQANVNPELIDSVIIGNVLSAASTDAPYVSRHVSLRLGIPKSVPALTVNRLCGSGFQAVVNASHEIQLGDAKIVLAGGTDNMSQCPFAARNMRFGTKLGEQYILEDMMWAALTDAHIKTPMGVTAENLAEQYKITREDVDEFAYKSQMGWKKCQEGGFFKDEIAPVMVKTRKGEKELTCDEHPKPETTREGLAKLPSVFKKNGTVTAGTASGICDGAGALVVASEEACKKHNLKPLARLVAYGIAGCDPSIMGIGPVPAIQKMLKAASMQLKDIDLIEINEAFAPQTLACQRALDIDPAILNVNGGAIALGHPLAASGARITSHLTHELRQKKKKYGIGSACIGGGQGIALLLESIQ